MKLRIGYVNVRGLSTASWDACHQLLNTWFDFLFIAETWFVNHHSYSRDRRFIASTMPPPKNLRGRPRGGIYLLGSGHVRSQVAQLSVTEHSITVSHGPYTISAVYCPPTTLDARALISLLNELQSSTVILGDINTRFRDPIYQAGEPGPPQRLQVITDFLTQTNFRHVKPVHSREKLTTDHCFVQAGQRAQLGLLSNTSQKIKTDHQHTLSLTLGQEEEEEEQAAQKPTRASNIKRFRVSRLSHLNQREALRALIS
jgi:hypothetical protein